MTIDPELPYWLALRRAGLGSSNFALLLKRFGSIEDAWAAPTSELAKCGMEPKFVRQVVKARTTFSADAELRPVEELGVRVYTWLDEDFPPSLREIPGSPPVLFTRGSVAPSFPMALAVVGTRQVTPYGRQATEHFCEAVARAGVPIISGLARGVDAIAHRVAVECGVPTVAVLAGGIDQVYPRENAGLAERIVANGCLVSEYPIGIPARPDYFPRRNRILSGLARATLVVEAGEGSGALHTANHAFEQGRDVFAVPGSIFSRQSAGTNQLIRESTAKIVNTPRQLLEELNLTSGSTQLELSPVLPQGFQGPTTAAERPTERALERPAVRPAPAPEEAQVLAFLSGEPQHIDEIVRASGLPVGAASATLQIMELKGLILQPAPLTYIKA